ncbi:MAG: DNA-formamidopyrimidine glycosylase [Isosphaeraceae bacterium]
MRIQEEEQAMPELPEVETMVRGLRPAMVGFTLREAEVHDPFLLQGVSAEEFVRRVSGSEVRAVERRGKWVVIELEDRRGFIVIQPRMTGGFWLVSPARADHVRLTFHMGGPRSLIWFCDNRRLGKIAWYGDAQTVDEVCSRSQGPDALVVTRQHLAAGLKRTDRPVKPALMDQKLVAGIGNIYADEILFRSQVHPERKASHLTRLEVERIHAAISVVLNEAIRMEGSSFDAGYKTVLGLEGGFLATNAMYGRGGQACPDCGTSIVKTRIVGLAGRPTHFCPTCQPRHGNRRKSRSR